MGVKHVEAFGDSLLVVQQISSIYQCFNGSLNAYLDKYLKIIASFNDFTGQLVPRDENTVANDLTQQASGFRSNRGKLYVLEKTGRFNFLKWMVRFSVDAGC
jgi:ribonuclease HI